MNLLRVLNYTLLSLFNAVQKDEVYLNLVLDFVPETVYRVARHFNKAKSIIPIIYVKVKFTNSLLHSLYLIVFLRISLLFFISVYCE